MDMMCAKQVSWCYGSCLIEKIFPIYNTMIIPNDNYSLYCFKLHLKYFQTPFLSTHLFKNITVKVDQWIAGMCVCCGLDCSVYIMNDIASIFGLDVSA